MRAFYFYFLSFQLVKRRIYFIQTKIPSGLLLEINNKKHENICLAQCLPEKLNIIKLFYCRSLMKEKFLFHCQIDISRRSLKFKLVCLYIKKTTYVSNYQIYSRNQTWDRECLADTNEKVVNFWNSNKKSKFNASKFRAMRILGEGITSFKQ